MARYAFSQSGLPPSLAAGVFLRDRGRDQLRDVPSAALFPTLRATPRAISLNSGAFNLLRVLGLLEDGDVGVGVFQEGKEIVVGRFRLGTFACHRTRSRRCRCPRLPPPLLSKVLDHPDVAIGCIGRHRQMPPVGRRYSFGAEEIEFLLP